VTYRVRVASTAARQLTEQLPETVAVACVEFLYGPLSENPYRVGAPLRKPFEGYWRARRGEYRVRYTIDDSTETVRVLDISHRQVTHRRQQRVEHRPIGAEVEHPSSPSRCRIRDPDAGCEMPCWRAA